MDIYKLIGRKNNLFAQDIFNNENELQYGLEVLGYQTDFDFTNATGLKTEQKENSTEFFNISPEYLEEMKEQGIPLEAVLQLD